MVDLSHISSDLTTASYSQITPPLNVTEFADRVDAAQMVTLTYNATSLSTTNGSAFAILPPSWKGTEIQANIYELYENRCWSLNPEFNGPPLLGSSNNISPVFLYDNGLTAAVRKEGLDKTFYMAFVFGKIANSSSQDEIMNRTLTWMGLGTGADILIIDNDGGYSYETAYENSLTNLGYSYTTSAVPNWNSIRNRDLVIWCTGLSYDIESPSSSSDIPDNLIAYLDQTGAQNVIVSGQDVGFCLDDVNAYNTPDTAANNFYNNYLYANFLADDAESNVTLGYDSDFIGAGLSFYINGSGSSFLPDAILVNYQNNEALLNNWSSSEFGNKNNEEWYHRRERNGSGPNNDCAVLFLEDEVDGGYTTGDKVWIEQQLQINRSDVCWAGIMFDYWAFNTFAPYTGSFKIYVAINDTEVYSKSFSDISAFQRWFSTGLIPINTSAIPLPNINLKIGLEVVYGLNYEPDIKPLVFIDNFKLYLKTKVSPSQINLKMDGVDVVGGPGYGQSSLIATKPWTSSPIKVNFTWNPLSIPDPNLDISITFQCDTDLFASKNGQTLYEADPAKTGLYLETDPAVNNTWTFQYYVTVPNGYWNHSFIINHPGDWNVTFVSEPQLPGVNRISDCIKAATQLIIPATNITNAPDGYWRFIAQSRNYLQEIQAQIYNGTHWINTHDFFIGNTSRIVSYLSNGTGPPPNLFSSEINLTIYSPSGAVWYTTTEATYSNGWAIFPNMTIFGANSSAGQYEIDVLWNNGVEGGCKKSFLNIIHHSEILLSKPSDALTDQTTEINFGDLLLIRVNLNDTDNNELAKNVSLSLNWTQGGTPVQRKLNDLETGQYEIVLDTSELPTIDNYTIIISSYSPFFTNATYKLRLIITTETILSSPQFPKVIAEWGSNVTLQIYYQRAADEVGLNNSIIAINWTLGPFTILELGNGQYSIEMDLTAANLTEYTLLINATKPNSAYKEMKIKLEVISIATELNSPQYPKINAYWGTNLTFSINYQRILPEQGIENATVTVNWTLGAYNLIEVGNGIYTIELNLSFANIHDYILVINTSKPNYDSKTLYLLISVNSIETDLVSINYPRVVTEWGKNISIEITYRTALEHTGIENALITSNWTLGYYSIIPKGNGQYDIIINTTWCEIQEYLLEINASKGYHLNKTIQIIVQVNLVETILAYQPIESVPYGQNVTIYLKYTDLAGTIISSNLNGTDILTINYTYWVSYNSSNIYPYSVKIATLGLNQTDLLNITASKPKYKPQSILIFLTYRLIFTSVTNLNSTLIVLPEGESAVILVYFNDTDFSQGISGANLTFYGYENLSFYDLGGGYYQITFNATNVIDAYSILVTFRKFGYVTNNIQFIVQIKSWIEFTTPTFSTLVASEPVGSQAQFSVLLKNEFEGTPFENATVIYSWIFGTGILINNGNGNYSLEINTAGIPPGTYSITINATQDGYLLMSQSVTLVIISTTKVAWWVQYSWVFGIIGAVIAIFAGYRFREHLRQRDWEKKVKHIYILTKNGVPLYDKRLGGITRVDPSLVTSALIGISSIVQEIVHSKRDLKTIDHMDNKILFQHGFHVIVAVLSEIDLPIIRKKLAQLTNRFEYYYKDELENWKGDIDTFFGANKIINEFFPIEEYFKDREISAEWILERLFNMYGLPGIVTLLTIDLGLQDSKKIAAGSGIKEKQVSIILRTLKDLMLIDSENNLTKKGRDVISIYKERKEKYINILKLAKQKEKL
ncbi:MAG: hypothetical protein ACTSRS_08635 [Candidatus Helarchaeota archaeon]